MDATATGIDAMPDYHPDPLDTSQVRLPPDLNALLEDLARNTHEVWAAERMAEGWTWGPQRDDASRQHPCLVPYDGLPETEKEYDRSTAREVLKAIMAMGYRIEKSDT